MKKVIVLLVSLLLTACITGEQVAMRIEPGMSPAQVKDVLGNPDGFKQVGDYTIYKYTNRLISGWSWDRADYSFVFKDEGLVEYGAGEVRVKSVGQLHTVFLL